MNFREKANEIRAVGEQTRGDYTPKGAPARIYNYWLNNSESIDATAIRSGGRKENFCHYWRVVAIWSPLLMLGNKIGLNGFMLLIFLANLGIIIYAGVSTGSYLAVFGGVALGLSVALGTIAGILAARQTRADTEFNYDARQTLVLRLCFLFGLPTALLFFGISWLVLHKPDQTAKALGRTAFAVGVAAAASALIWVIAMEGPMVILYIIGIVGGCVLLAAALLSLGYGIVTLIEYSRGKQALRETQAKNEYFEKHGEVPPATVRKPSPVKKFFSGVGDFIVLIAQVVRVNKWKICPVVETQAKEVK